MGVFLATFCSPRAGGLACLERIFRLRLPARQGGGSDGEAVGGDRSARLAVHENGFGDLRGVFVHDGHLRPFGGEVLVAEVEEPEQNRDEFLAALGEVVAVPWRVLLVQVLLDEACV